MLSCAPEKAGSAGQRREMILSLQQGLAEEGRLASLVKLCHRFEMPRRSVYYRSTNQAPKAQEQLVRRSRR